MPEILDVRNAHILTGGARMINKKAIIGILAILVIFTTVQGIKPVLADNSMANGNFSININGIGQVCYSGAANGCTTSSTALSLHNGDTVTFTAMGLNGYGFIDWNIGSSTTSLYSALNPYTVTIDGSAQSLTVDFSPAWMGGGGQS
jgi:hypothetical protein